MNKLFFTLLLIVVTNNLYGQTDSVGNVHKTPHVALHFSSPLGLISKAGIKLEVRAERLSLLFLATNYHGIMPGYQFGLEGRWYMAAKKALRAENFYYIKTVGGHQNRVEPGSGFISELPDTYYLGAGAGVGRHINFNHFFIEFNGGLKATVAPISDAFFYITGPGALIDAHFNFGFQL